MSLDHPTTSHLAELEAWHAARMAALRGDAGWLHITDRLPLAEGRQSVGSAPENALQLQVGPAHLGHLVPDAAGEVSLEDREGVRPFPRLAGVAGMLRHGDLLLEIARLEGEVALRVRNLGDQTRHDYPALPRFAVDPRWDIDAAFEALPAPETLGITTITGVATSARVTHRARFQHEGAEVVLLVTHWRGDEPMLVFRDATAGQESYAGMRFLIGEVTGGRVRLDFNKAFNPPCSFTPHATCPLPPAQNRLALAIRAGEMAPPAR